MQFPETMGHCFKAKRRWIPRLYKGIHDAPGYRGVGIGGGRGDQMAAACRVEMAAAYRGEMPAAHGDQATATDGPQASGTDRDEVTGALCDQMPGRPGTGLSRRRGQHVSCRNRVDRPRRNGRNGSRGRWNRRTRGKPDQLCHAVNISMNLVKVKAWMDGPRGFPMNRR